MFREIVIVLSVASLVKCSQNCWQCSNEPNISVCRNNTVTCGATEQCFLEKSITNTNEVQYHAGCRSNSVCNMIESFAGAGPTGKRSVSLCTRCCTGPNCQDTLCGLQPSVGQSIPSCFSCQNVVSANACTHTRVCQDTEICSTSIVVVQGYIRFSYGCVSKHLCAILLDNDVHGRAVRDGVTICSACCASDRCNKADCYELHSNMTMAMVSH